MKRKYEIVYIFDSALDEPQVNEHLDRFHELLKSPDQTDPITGMAHWGKRTLAYPIKKKEVGYYVVAHVETETTLLSEFERIVKLDDTVMRYLVVINEGLPAARVDQIDSESPTAGTKDSEGAPPEGAEAPVVAETPAPAADEAPATEVEAVAAEVEAPATEVEAVAAEVEAPATEVEAVATEVEAPAAEEETKQPGSTDEGGE